MFVFGHGHQSLNLSGGSCYWLSRGASTKAEGQDQNQWHPDFSAIHSVRRIHPVLCGQEQNQGASQ